MVRYLGIYARRGGYWTAWVYYDKSAHYIGTYGSQLQAAQARESYITRNNLDSKVKRNVVE